jgi:hypothetical protein
VGSVGEGRVFSRARLIFSSGTDRLRTNGWSVVQSAVAASVAYLLAAFVLGHARPFFAAIAAVVCLGVTLGQRARRALELVFGVAFGLMVADLLVLLIGTGVAQIGVVVLLAMAAAVFFGGTRRRSRRSSWSSSSPRTTPSTPPAFWMRLWADAWPWPSTTSSP